MERGVRNLKTSTNLIRQITHWNRAERAKNREWVVGEWEREPAEDYKRIEVNVGRAPSHSMQIQDNNGTTKEKIYESVNNNSQT